MNHDEFVGQVQHRAHLPSRGDAETIIRATLETLRDRLQAKAAAHLAAQLPAEIGRHLRGGALFEHLSLHDFYERVAEREQAGTDKAVFHARCVIDVVRDAISPGAVRKLEKQMPEEFRVALMHAAA